MRIIVAATLALATAAGVTLAGELQYEPGRWKTTTSMHMPMLPKPQVRTTTECIEKGQWSADTLMKDDPNCSAGEPTITDRTVQWTVDCKMPNGSATGTGKFSIDGAGTRGSGLVEIQMNSGGQQMTMTMNMTSERLGDCP